MKCPSCNKVIKKTDTSCRFCNVKLEPKIEKPIKKAKIIYIPKENKANKWLILATGILSFIIIFETAFIIWYFYIKEPINDTKYKIESYNYISKLPFDIYSTNEDILFDNLVINISSKYEILKLENKYSIYDGQKVIKIPVKVTNKSNESHSLNLFYYNIYDDYGNNIDEVAGYFEESLYYAENLKKDESYTKYIYALYYGNDLYIIKIGNKNDSINVLYKIKK